MVLTQTKAAYTHESAPSKCPRYLVVQYWDERWRRNKCKSAKASRPVLVYRKLTRSSFIGLPLTSKPKEGTWYVPVTIHGTISRVIMSQMRIFDTRRITTRLAQLDQNDFNEVKRRLLAFLQE